MICSDFSHVSLSSLSNDSTTKNKTNDLLYANIRYAYNTANAYYCYSPTQQIKPQSGPAHAQLHTSYPSTSGTQKNNHEMDFWGSDDCVAVWTPQNGM